VTVVERDPTYRFASSTLSASSIRHQFSTPENILIGQYTPQPPTQSLGDSTHC
jgi:hypothetical protein